MPTTTAWRIWEVPRLKILIIEDNLKILAAIQEEFASQGYVVDGADRGAEGQEKSPCVRRYNPREDLGETKNVADEHPDVVKRLAAAYQAHLDDLKQNGRPAAKVKK